MRLIINGQTQNLDVTHLQDVLHALNMDEQTVATAVNGQFVSKNKRLEMQLNDGDAVEIVAPMQGG